ncbi:hypothetical protein ACLMJK_002993 [Lecanora helva]
MDGSPLTVAQSHVVKASKANTPTAAIDEHELAAGQFAKASKGIDNSSEAFRTLKLLEQHHEKLAQLIKFQNSNPLPPPTENTPETKSPSQQPQPTEPKKSQDASLYRPQSQSLPAAHRPPRDVSSSIASNLASARGIPSNRQRRSGPISSPALTQPHVEGKIVSPPRRSKPSDTPGKKASYPISEKPPISTASTAQNSTPSSKPTPQPDLQAPNPDEPFQRFYSTFESLFSKLSAPLAFAGLPLTAEDTPQSQPEKPTQTTPQRSTKSKREDRATVEPDYSRLFSKAALQAVREEPGGNNLGAAESFYVVPTTGGTMPYASVLARSHIPRLERDGTRTSEDMEEFVDARETPAGPPSPQMVRGGKKVGGKTMEELQLENETLRAMLENVSRRLQDFEMGAQTSSMALHQSIRASMKQSPTASSVAGGGGAGGAGVERLEEQVKEGKRELERLGKENEKLTGVVRRYRERWEKLKEGARVRREGTGNGKEEEM